MASERPTPGRKYTVVRGDTLSHIAAAAYGNGREWRRIWRANQNVLRSAKDSSLTTPRGLSGQDLIFPGEVIFIPGVFELDKIEQQVSQKFLSGKTFDDATLVINDQEVPVQSLNITRTFNSAADGWSATLAWEPDDDKLNELFRPFGYQKAQVYLGGHLLCTGYLYEVSRAFANTGITGDVAGWSSTADIIDSTIRPPYEALKQTLEQRARDLVGAHGIGVVYDLPDDSPFPKVTAGEGETVFSHLAELARQRNAVLGSTVHGELLITKANPNSVPVATLVEGSHPVLTMEASFDGRARFNIYRVKAQKQRKGKGKKAAVGIAKDNAVPRSRGTTVSAPDSTSGTIQQVAQWERSKRIANAVGFSVEVSTWYSDKENTKLWEVGDLVTIQSPSLFVPDGFTFLIRQASFKFSLAGSTTTLELTPPQAFTGEEIEEPWRL